MGNVSVGIAVGLSRGECFERRRERGEGYRVCDQSIARSGSYFGYCSHDQMFVLYASGSVPGNFCLY